MSDFANWIKTSPADDFWIFASIAVAIGIACFLSSFYFLIRKRVMEDTPTSKIRSAAQGYVEMEGYGEFMSGDTIYGPLTGKQCVWYKYEIEERRSSGKNDSWVTVEKETSEGLFLLIDDTGNCVIDPEGASVTVVEKDSWYGASRRPSSGPAVKKFFSSGRYRYTERRLLPKDPLYVMGLFKTVGNRAEPTEINEDVKLLLKEWKADSQRLLAKYDTNKDGEICMEEWEKAREDALAHVMAQHKESQKQPAINTLVQTNDRRRPFILSAVPQEDLVKRYKWYSGISIVVSLISATLAFYMISLRLSGN